MPEFRLVSEEEVFREWVLRVERLHMVDPGGEPFERVILRHPGAVVIIAAHDDGTVSLVREYRPAVDAVVLQAPAGTLDEAGESAEATARRELVEEAGLEAARWERLIDAWNTPGVSDQQTTIFLATGLTPADRRPQGHEEAFMSTERIGLADLDDLVADGTLRAATTVLGLYSARERLAGAGGRPA